MKTTPVRVLETTLRDGSYRIDFGFTAQDTERLTHALDRLGFPFIEVGHGVGIGASRRLQDMAAAESDESYIAAARRGSGRAEIAAFCVVGVADLDDVRRAADAGLQVLRIGINADKYAKMAPFFECARALGMKAMANLMKCYVLTEAEVGTAARACEDMGAQAFYVVDSAGTMLPDDVAGSIAAARAAAGIEIGFHGHNNLGLAIANSLRAIDEGATLIDSTLMGIGRCSGNAPTEMLVSLLQRIHGDCAHIDRHLVMQLADETIRPVLDCVDQEGADVTAYGMGGVHSSFSDRIEKYARDNQLSLYSLIEAIGEIDRLELSPDTLASAARKAKPARLLHASVGQDDLSLSAGSGRRLSP